MSPYGRLGPERAPSGALGSYTAMRSTEVSQ